MTYLKKNWGSLLLVLLLVGLGGKVVKYLVSPSPDRVRAQDVRQAARVEPGVDDRDPLPPGDFVGGNGIVEPKDREVKLAAPVPGRIARIAVVEGQRVGAGDVLVELEHEVEMAAFGAAEADVMAADAELSRLSRGNRREDIESADAEAEAARVRADLAESQLRRTEAIAASGGVSQEEIDRLRRQAEADRASAASLDARRRAVVSGARVEERSAARGRYLAAVARRDQAQAALERLTVRAPFAGEVLQVKYRVGEYVQPGAGDPLVILGDTSELRVRMDVDERDVGKVRVGSTALVRAVAFPGRDFPARVVEIGRRMGRKNVRSDDPAERNDTKILEVVLVLSEPRDLVVGQRVMAYVVRAPGEAPASAR